MVVGSSQVTLGATKVLAAVTLQVGVCSSNNHHGQGDIQVMVSPDNNIVLQSFLQRLLHQIVPLDQLAIQPASATAPHTPRTTVTAPTPRALRLVLTLHVIESAGNVRDACLLASIAALGNVHLPAMMTTTTTMTTFSNDRVWLVPPSRKEEDHPTPPSQQQQRKERQQQQQQRLRLPIVPVPLTFALWHGTSSTTTDENRGVCLVVDPTAEEEAAAHGIISLVMNANVNNPDDEDDILSLECYSNSSSSSSSSNTSTVSGIDPATLVLAIKIAKGRVSEIKPILDRHYHHGSPE